MEIRNFMVNNGGKVTNHDLVKYFKESLTHPDTQSELIGYLQYIKISIN